MLRKGKKILIQSIFSYMNRPGDNSSLEGQNPCYLLVFKLTNGEKRNVCSVSFFFYIWSIVSTREFTSFNAFDIICVLLVR